MQLDGLNVDADELRDFCRSDSVRSSCSMLCTHPLDAVPGEPSGQKQSVTFGQPVVKSIYSRASISSLPTRWPSTPNAVALKQTVSLKQAPVVKKYAMRTLVEVLGALL